MYHDSVLCSNSRPKRTMAGPKSLVTINLVDRDEEQLDQRVGGGQARRWP